MAHRNGSRRGLLLAGLVLMLGLTADNPAQAQYPYGPGFAFGPAYGVGYPAFGYGYGYPAYGLAAGSPAYSYGLDGAYSPGYGTIAGGYFSPIGPGSYGPGIPGYGPSGIGYANPLFGLGLSPLAVQNAMAERALVRGSQSAARQPAPIRYGPATTVTPVR